MSFGGTKNGCWAAEAIVVFDPGAYPDLSDLRQRAGHGLSKQRFIAAQYDGYLTDGAWLRTAAHANAMAARLREGLRASQAVRLEWRSTTNELFPAMAAATATRLRAGGARFHTWEQRGADVDGPARHVVRHHRRRGRPLPRPADARQLHDRLLTVDFATP